MRHLFHHRSFLRMWFPWSVCGNRCHSLEPDPDPDGSPVLPSQLPPRCLGFLTTPIGEWNAILVGILMNIGMSSLFGWVTVSFCDDGKLIPVPTAPTDNVTGGTSNLVAQHKYKYVLMPAKQQEHASHCITCATALETTATSFSRFYIVLRLW